MSKRGTFTYRKIVKILKSKGCEYKRCRWSHETRYNPFIEREFIVIKHKDQPMRIWTLKRLMEKSWLWEQYFMEFDD